MCENLNCKMLRVFMFCCPDGLKRMLSIKHSSRKHTKRITTVCPSISILLNSRASFCPHLGARLKIVDCHACTVCDPEQEMDDPQGYFPWTPTSCTSWWLTSAIMEEGWWILRWA